jgi:cytochrome c553
MSQDHEKSDIPNRRRTFLTAASGLTMAGAVGPMIGLLTLLSIAFAWQCQALLSRASAQIQAHASRLFALSMLTVGALRHATFAAAASSIVEPSSSLVATCAACHGAAGQGSAARGIPRLAGQNADLWPRYQSLQRPAIRWSGKQSNSNVPNDVDARSGSGTPWTGSTQESRETLNMASKEQVKAGLVGDARILFEFLDIDLCSSRNGASPPCEVWTEKGSVDRLCEKLFAHSPEGVENND